MDEIVFCGAKSDLKKDLEFCMRRNIEYEDEIIKLRYALDAANDRVRELEVQAAVLRKVLEDGRLVFRRVSDIYCNMLEQAKSNVDFNKLIDNFKRSVREAVETWVEQVNQALSVGAGKEPEADNAAMEVGACIS